MISERTELAVGGQRARRRARRFVAALLAAASLVAYAVPAGAASASPQGSPPTTLPLLGQGPGATTTTTAPAAPSPAAPASTTSVAPTSTTTTSGNPKTPPSTGVPSIPVGGPPTTTPKKGGPPTTLPNPAPILAEVQQYLTQVAAVNQYQADKNLVQVESLQVQASAAAVRAAQTALGDAQSNQQQAATVKATADAKMRSLALAAYIGVGFTSTQVPGGGVTGLDTKELLLVVSQHIVDDDKAAKVDLAASISATRSAADQFRAAVASSNRSKQALASARHAMVVAETVATTGTALAPDPAGNPQGTPLSPSILGSAVLAPKEMAAWYASTGYKPATTVPIAQLADDYAQWGQKLGIRDDIAFAQSIVETGYFSFPAGGQLTGKDNNFAGIGACDSCATGWSFPDASTGVAAQLELLYEYASTDPLPSSVKNVIGATGVGGCCSTWAQLAGKWATSTVYGISIMTVYQKMLAWALPRREITAGITTSDSTKASSPSPSASKGAAAPGARAS